MFVQQYTLLLLFVCLVVFNTTFNNISVISWWSVLLVEESGGPGVNHRPVASHWQTLSYNVEHLTLIKIQTQTISGDRHWLHRYQLPYDHSQRRPHHLLTCVYKNSAWTKYNVCTAVHLPFTIIFWIKLYILWQ
jgi:hypothetical protein